MPTLRKVSRAELPGIGARCRIHCLDLATNLCIEGCLLLPVEVLNMCEFFLGGCQGTIRLLKEYFDVLQERVSSLER